MTNLLQRPALIGLIVLAAGCGIASGQGATTAVTVVGIGDSLLSGYGVPRTSNFSAVLEQHLKEEGYDADVVETGLQYTSKSGAYFLEHPFSRVEGRDIDLSAPNTVVIIEVGGNDCIEGLPLSETRANLEKILTKLLAGQIPVLFAGTAAFESCGPEYAIAFDQLFSEMAINYGVLLYPEFKNGLVGHAEFFQADLDHPNEAGVALIVESILPAVRQLISELDDR